MKKTLKLLLSMSIITGLIAFAGICSFAGEGEIIDSGIIPSYLTFDDESIEDDILSVGEEFDPANYEFNVLIDGQYVEFEDAAPANVKGRVMVPFRVILETLGAEVQYEPKTKTVTAVLEDTIISFAVGSSELSITENGKKISKKMDVVPYIDAKLGRTYVSSRFVAESLGYTVGWDSDEKTVVIIDYDKLLEGIDSDFSIINKYLKSSQVEKDAVYEQTIEMAVEATVYKSFINLLAGEEVLTKDIKFNMNFGGNSITKNNEVSLDMVLSMNLKDLISSLPSDEVLSDEEMAELEKFDNITILAYANMDSGDLYFKSNLDSLIDQRATDTSWFKLNLYDVTEGLGIDIESLVKDSLAGNNSLDSVGAIMNSIIKGSEDSMTISTYDELYMVYEGMKSVLGNDSIKVKKSGGSNIYTIDLSNINDLLGMNVVKGKAVIKEKNGEYTCDIGLTIAIEGLSKISLNMDSTNIKSDSDVEKVPADAEIIDLSPLFNDLYLGL